MSLNNGERKFNLKTDTRNIKQNNHKNIKKTHKKLYNGLSQDNLTCSNNYYQNNRIVSPTWNNISKNKTKINSNNYKKQPNIASEEYKLFNKKIKKKKEENAYKHNKSLEEFSINNDILLHYKVESPLIPGNIDNCGDEIIEILDLNGDNFDNQIKKQKLNNSYILQPKYKSIINDFENKNNSKINEYITEYKNGSNKNKKGKHNKNININLLNDDIDNRELIIDSEIDKNLITNKNKNANNILSNSTISAKNNIVDEYLLNSSFENNKNDFSLLYTNKYHKNIKNDMLVMEIQLLIEKILELQKSYHREYKDLSCNYKKEKKALKIFHEKNIYLKKKMINLLKLKEKNNLKENNKIYIGLDSKKNINNDSLKINKNEVYLLNKMFITKEIIDDKDNKKSILKQIFKNVVYDRYKFINLKLNDIEKTIINRLFKKYQFNNKLNTNNKKSINNKNCKNNNKGNNKKLKNMNVNTFNKNNSENNNFKYNFRAKIY